MSGQRLTSLLDVDDSAFLRTLGVAFAELKIESEAELVKVAYEVVNRAKMFCPVDTDNLRSSLDKSDVGHDSQGVFVSVGTPVVYAPFVEFGTYKMHAQPFLRPALAEASRGVFKWVSAEGRIGAWGPTQITQARSLFGIHVPSSRAAAA